MQIRGFLFLCSSLAFASCGGSPPAPETPAGSGGAKQAVPEEPEETGAGGGEAGGEAGEAEEEDTRTTQSVQKVILDNRKTFRACYDSARKQKKDLGAGTLTLHFVLDPDGKVKKAELNQERSTLQEPKLVECALAQLKNLSFPPSSKGMDTTVNYPFDFKPDGG
jgi:outer membrane biosynthesis protein TonB